MVVGGLRLLKPFPDFRQVSRGLSFDHQTIQILIRIAQHGPKLDAIANRTRVAGADRLHDLAGNRQTT